MDFGLPTATRRHTPRLDRDAWKISVSELSAVNAVPIREHRVFPTNIPDNLSVSRISGRIAGETVPSGLTIERGPHYLNDIEAK